MGMYTELIIGAGFCKETPEYIIEAFDYIINKNYEGEISEDAQKFIDEYNVNLMFQGCSYYFAVTNPNYAFWKDKIDNTWHLSSRANLKNNGRIEKFLTFIMPYVSQGSGILNIFAYVHYEEDEFPKAYSTNYGVFKLQKKER